MKSATISRAERKAVSPEVMAQATTPRMTNAAKHRTQRLVGDHIDQHGGLPAVFGDGVVQPLDIAPRKP